MLSHKTKQSCLATRLCNRSIRDALKQCGIRQRGMSPTARQWVQCVKICSLHTSVQFSCSVMSNSLRPHGLQHTRPSCPSPTPRAYSNSRPWSQWCHPTISCSVIPFSSCLQSFPASGSFPMSQFFASGGQSSGVSASASVLPMNIQDWFPLGWTGDLFVVQRTLKSLLQYHSSKAHIKPTHTLISGPSLTMQGQKIFPAQPGGGTDDGSMTSTKEWQRKSSPYFPLFLWLKTVAH